MIVVSDTSPLRALLKIQHLHLLPSRYQNILVPHAVMKELNLFFGGGKDLSQILNSLWVEIGIIKNKNEVELLLNDLDPGEAEAIVLAKENNASLILIDEASGRSKAQSFGLNVPEFLEFYLKQRR
ncbi:MAG: hypothetical protein LH473_11955 [Chitinophagales bacterium]|nr:hypothetical protein [Chitinophagales bacterium]